MSGINVEKRPQNIEDKSVAQLFNIFLVLFCKASLAGLENNLNSNHSPQILLALSMIWFMDDLPDLVSVVKVRIKSFLPRRKIYLSQTTEQHFFRALIGLLDYRQSVVIICFIIMYTRTTS